ncbi:MAG: transcriptional repressor [Prevotellaceae bacterium]|nr:transcriptional repressor [Prevotellaceae bacterium]
MDKRRRNTRTKQMIMTILSDSLSALCYEDFEKQLSGTMDKATVYRILQGFCNDGKVHKIAGDDGKTYYALCRHCRAGNHSDNHLHFRCTRCRAILCIDKQLPIPDLPSGYIMTDVRCLVSGHCPDCFNKPENYEQK